MKMIKTKLRNIVGNIVFGSMYFFLRILPLQNKVVVRSTRGLTCSDNPKYIVKKIKEKYPGANIVWVTEPNISTPSSIQGKVVSRTSLPIKMIYEYYTAKVWVDTHPILLHLKKRKGQLVINTWHGGIAIKKIGTSERAADNNTIRITEHSSKLTDLFIANTDFIVKDIRKSLGYTGPILKCGYPRNDDLLRNDERIRNKVLKSLGISKEEKLLLYAPTFRDYDAPSDTFNMNYEKCIQHLETGFSGKWRILVKYHPYMKAEAEQLLKKSDNQTVINVTDYPDMQELLSACDAFVTDFSSAVFEAELREIPCFILVKDYEQYKAARGLNYELQDLPFPTATTEDAFYKRIDSYDPEKELPKWREFVNTEGIYESGHSADTIADIIIHFMKYKAMPELNLQLPMKG